MATSEKANPLIFIVLHPQLPLQAKHLDQSTVPPALDQAISPSSKETAIAFSEIYSLPALQSQAVPTVE